MTLTALEKSGKVQICNLTLRPFGFFYVPIEASLKSIKVTGAVRSLKVCVIVIAAKM